jgi:hypothetical protein
VFEGEVSVVGVVLKQHIWSRRGLVRDGDKACLLKILEASVVSELGVDDACSRWLNHR